MTASKTYIHLDIYIALWNEGENPYIINTSWCGKIVHRMGNGNNEVKKRPASAVLESMYDERKLGLASRCKMMINECGRV